MPRDLFRDVVHPQPGVGSRRWYTLPVSILVHAGIVLAMIVLPLLAADVLPVPRSVLTWLLAAPVAPPDVPPAPVPRQTAVRPLTRTVPAGPPVEAPSGIREETGLIMEPEPGEGIEGGVAAVIEGTGTKDLPAPPLLPPAPVRPIRVHSGIRPPTKVRHVAPAYPSIAQSARVQGTVIVEAVIGVDGRVQEARILRSIPLLDQAALDAVRQWVFTPTLLSGVPVPVVMTVTVTFTLK